MERYELLKDIGAGNFGVARLMRNKETKELVAMKYIPRGLKASLLRFFFFFFLSLFVRSVFLIDRWVWGVFFAHSGGDLISAD